MSIALDIKAFDCIFRDISQSIHVRTHAKDIAALVVKRVVELLKAKGAVIRIMSTETDQTEVVVKFGSQQERIKVTPNKPPDIKIERVTTKMNNSDIYVQELQRITAFTVTIIDNRPDQLKVTYSGPISVSGPQRDAKNNLVYNVSLKLAANENRYDEWVDRNENMRESDGRYKANFFFTVVDERTKDRVQVGDSFFFTDFSK